MEKIIINKATKDELKNTLKNPSPFTPPRILVSGFAVIILVGTFLLSLPPATVDGNGLPLLDALFTATSAVCVTGLVVVDTGTHFTIFGQLVIMFLIQVGGLGFMTFATIFAIILGRKIFLKERLLLQEALNQLTMEGIVRLSKYVIQISLIIEGIGALFFTLRWQQDMGWVKAFYFGVFHAISGFNNAGFDLFGGFSSLTGYQGDIITNFVMMFVIITGGFGFAVLSDLYTHRGKKFTLHSRVVIQTSAILIVVGAIVIFLLELNNPATLGGLDAKAKALGALFQAVTPRTAGFNTIGISEMRVTTQLFIILLMFIGASPGSTGGGVKTTTFMAVMLSIINTFKGSCHLTLKERTIPKDVVQRAVTIIFLAMLLIIIVTLFLTMTENRDFLTILFEAVSAFGTVGLSLGITPDLSSLGKAAIIFTMFCGRVGPLTLAFALYQKRNVSNLHIKYPEERIIIG